MDKDLLDSVNEVYDFTIQSLLYYQRLFNYSGDILQLLCLPYNIYQDLILKQIELRKKEQDVQDKTRPPNQIDTIKNRPVPRPLIS